jgi:tetratricopeptide (TPR) repeat protein
MGEGWAHRSLSVLAGVQGRYADALSHTEQGLCLFQAIGDEVLEAEMLNGVAWSHALAGDYQQARAFCEQSLVLIAKLGGCHFEGDVWDTLGYIEFHLGDFARAADHFDLALALCRDGDRSSRAWILTHAGDARHAVGELPQARRAWQQALAILDDLQHPSAGQVRAKLASIED